MRAIDRTQRPLSEFMTGGMKVIAALAIMCTIAIAGCLFTAVSIEDNAAYAAIYTVNDAEQDGQASSEAASSDGAAAADEAEDAEGEAIEDDENPMSSGLDDAMAVSSTGIPLYAYVIIGIVAVVVFYLVSTRKLNSSISKMNKSVR